MARGAEFGCPVEVPHHSFCVPLRILADFIVRYLAGNRVTCFVNHHGRNAHHKTFRCRVTAADADGVAGHAGETILVELTVDYRFLRQSPAQNADRIMTTVAMAGVFDALVRARILTLVR